MAYNIGVLAAESGVRPETIRYFEKIGLLAAPERQENGYRRYSARHLHQLKFIQRCRELGFRQADTRELVTIFNDVENHSRAEVRQIAFSHLCTIHKKIKLLQQIAGSLQDMTDRCDGGELPASGCPILESLE